MFIILVNMNINFIALSNCHRDILIILTEKVRRLRPLDFSPHLRRCCLLNPFPGCNRLTGNKLCGFSLKYLNCLKIWQKQYLQISYTSQLELSLSSVFNPLGCTPEDEASEVTFMVPKKEISMVPDMGKWKRSQVGFCLWVCAFYSLA